jgi:hypothetical protein
MEAPGTRLAYLGRKEGTMGGETPDDGEEQDEQEAAKRRRRRRERGRIIRQLLIDWSPVLAAVANLVMQRHS